MLKKIKNMIKDVKVKVVSMISKNKKVTKKAVVKTTKKKAVKKKAVKKKVSKNK